MKPKRLLLPLLFAALLVALNCLPAMGQQSDAPERGMTLRIDYTERGSVISMYEYLMEEAPDHPLYTGVEIIIDEAVSFVLDDADDQGALCNFDWSELAYLGSLCDPSGYGLRFDGLKNAAVAPNAFEYSAGVTRVEGFGGIAAVGDSAFKGCTLLERVDFTSALVAVGSSAFAGCAKLEKMALAPGAEVGSGAFADCAKLADVGDAVLLLKAGDVAEGCKSGTFAGCGALSKIRLAGGSIVPADTFSSCSSLENVTLGDNMTLSAGLLSDARNLKSLTVGGSARIGDGAFTDRQALTTLSLGAGAVIGQSAFLGCSELKEVALGAGALVGNRAFAGCIRLQALSGKLDAVGEAAFLGCDKLATVELKANGAPVGASAFSGCVALSEVTGKVSSAAKEAFEGCKALKTIALTDGARVDAGAFQDCISLESVTGKLGPVGRNGFSGCTRLRSLNWPSVNTYGMDAFMGCALDFTKSVPAGLKLSDATRQIPYQVFTLAAKTVKVSKNGQLDLTSVYSLTTASGTPYSALRTPPYYWLDASFVGDADHSPRVTLTGTFDTAVPGSYPLKLSIPASGYASEHELSFTLEVTEAVDEGSPSDAGPQEHSWFLPSEFVATSGFSYQVVYGDASRLTLSSGKKSVCQILSDGTLKPVATGSATISAKDASGALRKCTVKVVPNRYAKSKPHKGEQGMLTASTKRLYYSGGKLYMELFIVNRTGKAVKNVTGAKLQLWDEGTGQLLYERNLGTLLKAKLANKGSRVFSANVSQALVNGGKKLDLGHGDVQARLVFGK